MLTRRRRGGGLAGAAAALAAAALPLSGGAAQATARCDWPMYGHDPGHSFAAPVGCSTLTPQGAAALVPSWWLPTPEPVSASPTIVDGTAYVGDWGGTFYAIPTDAPPGPAPTPRWTFSVDDTSGVAFGRITSTAAVATVAGRRVVVFGGGATLYVLDAASGQRVAATCLDPRADESVRCRTSVGQTEIESSPTMLVSDDGDIAQVLVGLDVHNDRGVGRTGLIALDLAVGADGGLVLTPRWKLDPEAGVAYSGADLLTRGAGTGQGCGGVWSSPAVDREAGLVFFGTASCSVDGVTSGESAWAADLATGTVLWQYLPPRTSTRLDDDFGASPNLLPGGLVGFASKDGWYYALRERPAAPGPELVWSAAVGEAGHVKTDFAVGGIIGTPAVGSVRGEPAIFATTALSTPLARPLDDGLSLDPALASDPQRLLSLTAFRAADGAVLWRSALSRQSYGAPAFANGVLLVPSTFSLSLDAFRADDGLPVAVRPLPGAPSSSPVVADDKVLIGVGTSQTDLEFKAFGGGALQPVLGRSPLSPLSGVVAFRVAPPAS